MYAGVPRQPHVVCPPCSPPHSGHGSSASTPRCSTSRSRTALISPASVPSLAICHCLQRWRMSPFGVVTLVLLLNGSRRTRRYASVSRGANTRSCSISDLRSPPPPLPPWLVVVSSLPETLSSGWGALRASWRAGICLLACADLPVGESPTGGWVPVGSGG